MPTQKDVANAAGVTPTTVSLILNGKAKERHIHPETVARVMEAMKELGYQPNTTARRLRSSGAERPIFALYGQPGLNLLRQLQEIDTRTRDPALRRFYI